jgi:threonyl-tRNA synthetase
MLVVGEKEAAEGLVNIRKQGTQQQETMKIDDFAKKIQEEVRQMTENF